MSYELIKQYDFKCDQPGCRDFCMTEGERIADVLDFIQREYGWQVVKGKQFCTEHRRG